MSSRTSSGRMPSDRRPCDGDRLEQASHVGRALLRVRRIQARPDLDLLRHGRAFNAFGATLDADPAGQSPSPGHATRAPVERAARPSATEIDVRVGRNFAGLSSGSTKAWFFIACRRLAELRLRGRP